MTKTYELYLHYKQGDDLANFIKQTKTSQEALLAWAAFMESNAQTIKRLVEIFEGKKLFIEQADTHFIQIDGDKECLKKAVKEKLLQIMDWEESEE